MLVAVTETPLDVAAHEDAVAHARAGAIVTFRGIVRDHDQGRAVVRLEYHAHRLAGDVLDQVAAETASSAEVLGVAVSHRVGVLEVGDTALVAAVSAEHRRVAFEACARLVDEVKHRLPVWKRQEFGDGTDEWVNFP